MHAAFDLGTGGIDAAFDIGMLPRGSVGVRPELGECLGRNRQLGRDLINRDDEIALVRVAATLHETVEQLVILGDHHTKGPPVALGDEGLARRGVTEADVGIGNHVHRGILRHRQGNPTCREIPVDLRGSDDRIGPVTACDRAVGRFQGNRESGPEGAVDAGGDVAGFRLDRVEHHVHRGQRGIAAIGDDGLRPADLAFDRGGDRGPRVGLVQRFGEDVLPAQRVTLDPGNVRAMLHRADRPVGHEVDHGTQHRILLVGIVDLDLRLRLHHRRRGGVPVSAHRHQRQHQAGRQNDHKRDIAGQQLPGLTGDFHNCWVPE